MKQKNGQSEDHFLPATGHHLPIALYDPMVRLLRKSALDRLLVDRSAISPGARVLEIGCGTGNVCLEVGRRQPTARVVGLDPDPRVLDRARRKAGRAGLTIGWEHGFAERLPFPDGSFERVLSSFMLHHLGPQQRDAALREAHRVLAAGGSLHLVDMSPRPATGTGPPARPARRNRLANNSAEQVTASLLAAGFDQATVQEQRVQPLIGRVTVWRALRTTGPR